MDERIGLVFSWDPRGRHWVKERGPADAPPPPAEPIDNDAVQTYFLDTQTGRWQSTILGMQARQISVALGNKYRAAMVVGLAILPPAMSRKIAPAPDVKRKGVPLMAGLAAVVVVIGAGAFVAQAMRPADVVGATPTAAPLVSAPVAASGGTVATAAPTAAPTTAPAPTEAPATQAPVRTAPPPPRTPAPTAPPVTQIVVYSTKTANGTTVVYRGPNGVIQGAALDGVISVVLPGGAGGTQPIVLYVGQLGTAQTATIRPDLNGNFVFSLKVTAAKGTQPMSFSLGANGEIRTLGTIIVR